MNPLTWSEIADRLSRARLFWLHTTGRDGLPNASPVWGAVVDDVLYHYTESRTVKSRNLAIDGRVIVHLESASDVLIVHGELECVGHPSEHPRVVGAFEVKYDRPEEVPYVCSSDPCFDVMYALRPDRALSWCLPDTENSTRRWTRSGK